MKNIIQLVSSGVEESILFIKEISCRVTECGTKKECPSQEQILLSPGFKDKETNLNRRVAACD